MKNRRNYYRLLHVQPDAPAEIIKASYRTLMQKLKLHPDMGGNEELASQINEAYAVLSNTEKREAYDKQYAIPNIHSLRGIQPSKSQDDDDDEIRTQRKRTQSKDKIVSLCSFCNTPSYFNLERDSRCMNCSSPLHPVTALDLEEICQRKVQRIISGGEITFFTHWPQSGCRGRIQDLSPKGMRFIGDRRLKQHGIIKIKSDRLESIARVVNCKALDASEDGFSVGVEFLTLLFHQISGTFVSDYV